MISRLTTAAVIFAVLATSTIAWAATTRLQHRAEVREAAVVVLPTVEIVVKRAASAPADAQR